MSDEMSDAEAVFEAAGMRLVDLILHEMGESTEAMRGGEIIAIQMLEGLIIMASNEDDSENKDYEPSAYEVGAMNLLMKFLDRLAELRSPWPYDKEGI